MPPGPVWRPAGFPDEAGVVPAAVEADGAGGAGRANGGTSAPAAVAMVVEVAVGTEGGGGMAAEGSCVPVRTTRSRTNAATIVSAIIAITRRPHAAKKRPGVGHRLAGRVLEDLRAHQQGAPHPRSNGSGRRVHRFERVAHDHGWRSVRLRALPDGHEKVRGACRPVLGHLREQLPQHAGNAGAYASQDLRHKLRCFPHDVLLQHGQRAAAKGQRPVSISNRMTPAEYRSDARVDRLAERLLGRHVVGRAEDGTCPA